MSKKPNVVFIFADDLGYGDVSSFNENGKIHTQYIDKLAEEGMKFTDSHSSSPICSPSRYALLTGRYNFRSPTKYGVLPGDSGPMIEKDRMTLANLFKENGYKTACVGKWHVGIEWATKAHTPDDYPQIHPGHFDNITERKPYLPAPHANQSTVLALDIDFSKPIVHGPCQYGFDYFYGLPASIDQAPHVYIENNTVLERPTQFIGPEPSHIPPKGGGGKGAGGPGGPGTPGQLFQFGLAGDSFDINAVGKDMNNKVLSLIDEYAKDDQPFFLYYPTPLVHAPHVPDEEFRGKSGIGNYGDWVLQLDHYVGEITQKLKDNGILDDTMIVFTSDNGFPGGPVFNQMQAQGHSANYIFRGHKGGMYEGGHRVPTIVRYPKEVEAGSTCSANVCHTDFFATFADYFGATVPEDAAEDSFSNLGLWHGTGECHRTATVCNAFMGYIGLIKGDYKLCCKEGGTLPEWRKNALQGIEFPIEYELYNLAEDVCETTDLAAQHPEIVADLKQELMRIFNNGRSNPGKIMPNYVPEGPWVQVNIT